MRRSYEADESSSKPQPSAETPAEAPAVLAPPQDDVDQNVIKTEPPLDVNPESFNQDSNNYEQNNGDHEMAWNGSNGNNNQYQNQFDGGPEPEPQAIGIKEDG